MGFMRKQMLMQQRASFEQTLEDRLSYLSEKGINSLKVDKDTIVKKLKADITAVNERLRAIADNDKRTEETAKLKAERVAASQKEEGGKGGKPKKFPEEGKGKKIREASEGGKS